MQKVYKYSIGPGIIPGASIFIAMPSDAKLLHFDSQNEDYDFQLWALVDLDRPEEVRRFQSFGTGHEIDFREPGKRLSYVDTAITLGGKLVVHLFEVVDQL